MEFKKAFDYIVGKVEEELVKQNYTKQKVVAAEVENGIQGYHKLTHHLPDVMLRKSSHHNQALQDLLHR